MKQSAIGLLLFATAILWIQGCDIPRSRGGGEEADVLREQLEQQEEFIQKMANEKQKINDLVNGILEEKDELMTEERVSKMEAEEKMEAILEVIERGERRIKALEKELKNQDSDAVTDFVSPELKNLRTRLTNLTIEIKRMQAIIAEKDSEILNLKEENDLLLGVIQTKDTEIGGLQEEKGKLTNEIADLGQQKQQLERQQQRAQEELAQEYYTMGVEWKDAADEARGRGRKEKKRDYVAKAIMYFEKAEELGNTQASKMINILKSDKNYQEED